MKGTVYARGDRLAVGFKNAEGEWKYRVTEYRPGEEEKARELLRRLQEAIARGDAAPVAGPLTFRRYFETWTEDREKRGIASAKDEKIRLRLYALRWLGDVLLSELRPRHVRDWIRALTTWERPGKKGRRKGRLAPRTILHTYATVHRMFEDAVAEEIIEMNPCKLRRGELPKKRDADPTWRSQAVFTRAEVEALLSDERVPEDRRVLYAIRFLTGLRPNEEAALRWRFYDRAAEPLGRITIALAWDRHGQREKGTKTERPREVPVHPTLAKVLAAWKLSGFKRYTGRDPSEDDLIIPSETGKPRNVSQTLERFHGDLDKLGLRRRRQYDSRRTFISLAQGDGARKDVLRWVTHGPSGDVFDAYTTLPWPTLCEAVACLRIELREGRLIELPNIVAAGAEGSVHPGLTTGLTTGGVPEGAEKEKGRKVQHLAALVGGRGVRDSNPWPPP